MFCSPSRATSHHTPSSHVHSLAELQMMESDDIYDGAEKEWNVFPFLSLPSLHQASLFFFSAIKHIMLSLRIYYLFHKIVFRELFNSRSEWQKESVA